MEPGVLLSRADNLPCISLRTIATEMVDRATLTLSGLFC